MFIHIFRSERLTFSNNIFEERVSIDQIHNDTSSYNDRVYEEYFSEKNFKVMGSPPNKLRLCKLSFCLVLLVKSDKKQKRSRISKVRNYVFIL